MEPTSFYLPAGMVSPATTWFIIVAVGIVLPGVPLVLALIARARHLLHARQAAHAMSEAHAPTHLGPLVLAGKVADDGEGPAVTIAVTQRGRDWSYKGQWNTEWRELTRAVTVRPFYVVRPSGERVRVEPDEDVFLVDRLDGLEDRGNGERVRMARLTAGELVFVIGTATHGFDPMQGGYRDGAVGFVVRRPRGQRMLVSTEPLTERHKKLARDDGKLALLLLLLLAVTHGLVFLRAWTLRLGGHVTNALVMDADTYQSYVRNKYGGGHWVTHYRLTITTRPHERMGPGSLIWEDTSPYCYWRAREDKIDHVPFLQAGPFSQLGTEAAISEAAAMMYPMLALPYVLVVLAWRARKRPWYLQRKLNERVGGRLDPAKFEFK